MQGFIKGVGVGVVVGAAVAAASLPIDHRRMAKTPVGRACKTVGNVISDIHDAF